MSCGWQGKGDVEPAAAANHVRLGDKAKELGRPAVAADFYDAAFNLALARGERALRVEDCAPVDSLLDVADCLLSRAFPTHANKLASTAALLADAASAQRLDAAAGNLAPQHLVWGDRLQGHGLEKQAHAQWQVAAELVNNAVRCGLAADFDIDAKAVFDLALELTRRASDGAATLMDCIDAVVGDDILAFADLARAMIDAGFADQARTLWPRLLERQPYHLESWRDYALALVVADDVGAGTQALKRAISLDESRRGELLAVFGERVTAQQNRSPANSQGASS